jgi:hypothetical protein
MVEMCCRNEYYKQYSCTYGYLFCYLYETQRDVKPVQTPVEIRPNTTKLLNFVQYICNSAVDP